MLNSSILDLIARGGYVIFILAICSLFSVKVIVEKLIVFKGIKERTINDLMDKVYHSLESNNLADALYVCKTSTTSWLALKIKSPLSNVIKHILEQHKQPKSELEASAYTQLDKELAKMERGLGILSTLGSISPFIGLFGTVIGIIESFNALSINNTSNYSSVMSGIADALIATAAGLIVAVPAVMFFNYFNKRLKLSMPLFDEAIQNTIRQLKTSGEKKQ